MKPWVRWAFYLFILSLPFEYPRRTIPWETTTITCALFLLAALFQPRMCFRRFPGAAGAFALFLYVLPVSFAVNGGEYGDEFQKLFTLQLQMVLLLWAGYNALEDERVFRQAPIVLGVACLARAAVQLAGIGVVYHEEWSGGERISALGQNANHSAMIMTAGLIALLGVAYSRSASWPRRRFLIWPIAAVIGVAIIQNGSRGGVIALGIGLATFALGGGGGGVWLRVRNASLVLVTLGLLVVASYNTEAMRGRFLETASTGAMAGRERVYPELLHMFGEQPVFGYGPVANKYELGQRLPEQRRPRRDAHNLLLEVMTSTGVVGLIPFLLGLWLTWRAAWRARRGPDGILPLALLVSVLMANMSGNWLAAPLLWFVFAYALASERLAAPAPAVARRAPALAFAAAGRGGARC